jgi:hypothetical protein
MVDDKCMADIVSVVKAIEVVYSDIKAENWSQLEIDT